MDKVAYRSAGTRALPKSHTNSLSAEDDLPHSNLITKILVLPKTLSVLQKVNFVSASPMYASN